MAVLEISNFTCERDDHPLFEAIDFSFDEGDIVQIAGPNGAGKTTMLRSLCGLFSSYTGEIRWRGEVLNRPSYDFKNDLLYLGHQPGIKRSLTARENLTWLFGIHGKPCPSKVEEVLEKVGLTGYEDIPCNQMSAGQQRRVALSKLFVTDAPFWVLDEPFTAIDVRGVSNLEQCIQAHAANGGTVLLTTHQALSIESYKKIELTPFRGEL